MTSEENPREKTGSPSPPPAPIPYLRLSITGLFMGLANLVPGVSGGTMILVLGLYEEFIGAFSDLTRLRISKRAVIVVGIMFGISALTILSLADGIQFLMETFLPGMLALFIGMTLGGVPLIYKEIRPLRPINALFALIGIGLMALIAFVFRPDSVDPGWLLFFLGGVVGSSAMILPGISGSYMLLIMGLYLPIIGGISQFKEALKLREISDLMSIGTEIILPVGLGLVLGLVILTNLLKYLLKSHHNRTLSFLIGLLLGSVLGLYPFQETTFDKLPRYAVASETAPASSELRVMGFGWESEGDNPVLRNLRKIERDGLTLKILSANTTATLDTEVVEKARAQSAVLIAYDIAVSREARRAAARKTPPQGVEENDKAQKEVKVKLLIVPNTEFSTLKLLLALLLTCVGFSITLGLGKFDGAKGK